MIVHARMHNPKPKYCLGTFGIQGRTEEFVWLLNGEYISVCLLLYIQYEGVALKLHKKILPNPHNDYSTVPQSTCLNYEYAKV